MNFHEHYRELNDYFGCFVMEKLIVGIEFSNVHDASVFKRLIHAYSIKSNDDDTDKVV